MCGSCEVKDDFIGQTFPTPKGGVLTVVGVVGKSGTHKKYGLTCSICHQDVELFPDLFENTKGNLVNGRVPCGCSKSPRRSEQQVNIIIRRLCEKENYKYLGFPESYKNKNSKFEYNCHTHGKQTVSYDSFVNGGSRCPECGTESMKDKQRNPEAENIVKELCEKEDYEFIGFPVGYKNAFSKFDYNCHTHGKQTVSYDSFVRGTRCPKCGIESIKDKLRNSEAENIVKELCESEGYEYLGFPESYANNYSKFDYNCHTHGKQTVSYNSFVRGGSRCPECAGNKKKSLEEAENIAKELCESEGYEFNGFLEGYKNAKSKFIYKCHTHGKQTSSYNHFVNGGRRCPSCGTESMANKCRNSEAENIAKELCEKEGYEFIGFPDGYENNYSKFDYNCHIHGKQTVSYINFVNQGNRCPSCSNYGYQPAKPGHLYVTNWVNNDKDINEFFKIGITNYLEQRIKQQARKTLYKPRQLIVFKFLDGSIPQELERLTKPYRQDMEHPIITKEEFYCGTTEILQNWIDIIKILPELIDTIRVNGYTPEIEVGKRLYNKLMKLDKKDMAQAILDHLYK